MFSVRPFRELSLDSLLPTWQRVTELRPGRVYLQGNITQFLSLTAWRGNNVMYIGDHVYSDLAVCLPLLLLLLLLFLFFLLLLIN